MAEEKQPARVYEEVLVLHPDASDKEKKQLYQNTSKIIKDSGGKVFRLDTWGSRPLAHPEAKKLTRAYYFHMIFQAEPQAIAELRRRLRINDKVVYFHHERLPSKKSVEEYTEDFLQGLALTTKKETERLAKFQKKSEFKR